MAERGSSPECQDFGLNYPGKKKLNKKDKRREKTQDQKEKDRKVQKEEEKLLREGKLRRLNIDMDSVIFIEDRETLSREMKAMKKRSDELRRAGFSLFVGTDTEQERITHKKNQVCVIQFSYKVSKNKIRTLIIKTDSCLLHTPKHEAAGLLLFLNNEFLEVMEDDNIVFVAVATKQDLAMIAERF